MGERKEAKLLKERAFHFLELAKEAIERKMFDLAAFHIEQFCQLYLKYKLLLKIGDFPKTHSLRELLIEIGKVDKTGEVKKFLNKNLQIVKNLENAYLTSRYLPIEFDKDSVKEMLNFAKKLKRFFDKI